uniref:Uncharacterized protein n=2 Tax=Clytia hemisphaerica TaxID=252671 RepID=A0A7M5X6Y4_9CNID
MLKNENKNKYDKMEMDIEMDSEVKRKPPMDRGGVGSRKLTRQTPLSKNSPSRVRRAHTMDTRSRADARAILEEREDGAKRSLNIDETDCVYVRKSSNKNIRKTSEERRQKYIRDRRHTVELGGANSIKPVDNMNSVTATQCNCRNHKGGLGCRRCRRVRRLTDTVTESELMQHETKLIVLEFLRSLRPDQLRARSRSFEYLATEAPKIPISKSFSSFTREELELGEKNSDEILSEIQQMKKVQSEIVMEREEPSKQTEEESDSNDDVEMFSQNREVIELHSQVNQTGGGHEHSIPSAPGGRVDTCFTDIPMEPPLPLPPPPVGSRKQAPPIATPMRPKHASAPPLQMNGIFTQQPPSPPPLPPEASSLNNNQMPTAEGQKRTDSEKAEKRNSVIKYNTMTIGEADHMKLLEMLRQNENKMESTGGAKFGRSRSDISEEKYAAVRSKIQAMKVPVAKWLDEHSKITKKKILQDIRRFDKSRLANGADGGGEKKQRKKGHRKTKSWSDKKNSPGLSLKIPKNRLPPIEDVASKPLDTDIFTPETMAVNKLEIISQQIMEDFPNLLENPITQMIKLMANNKNIEDYDQFTRVAKPVYEMTVQKTDPQKVSVWSRVAMVLYVVRETLFQGNLNDTQMEMLVEHSTKFFTENAVDTVKNEGGWEGALGEEIFNSTCFVYDEPPMESSDECLTHGDSCPSTRHSSISTDDVTSDSNHSNSDVSPNQNEELASRDSSFHSLVPYGAAVGAVALGLMYSYSKH